MSAIELRLEELGLELPDAVAPLYRYVSVMIHNGVAYISGQVPRINGMVTFLIQVKWAEMLQSNRLRNLRSSVC